MVEVNVVPSVAFSYNLTMRDTGNICQGLENATAGSWWDFFFLKEYFFERQHQVKVRIYPSTADKLPSKRWIWCFQSIRGWCNISSWSMVCESLNVKLELWWLWWPFLVNVSSLCWNNSWCLFSISGVWRSQTADYQGGVHRLAASWMIICHFCIIELS